MITIKKGNFCLMKCCENNCLVLILEDTERCADLGILKTGLITTTKDRASSCFHCFHYKTIGELAFDEDIDFQILC